MIAVLETWKGKESRLLKWDIQKRISMVSTKGQTGRLITQITEGHSKVSLIHTTKGDKQPETAACDAK